MSGKEKAFGNDALRSFDFAQDRLTAQGERVILTLAFIPPGRGGK